MTETVPADSLPANPPAIVVAPTPMPWDGSTEALDHDKLASNVRRWSETTLSGFVVGSGGGEETYMNKTELREAVTTIAQARGGRQLVIAGIDNPSTTEALRLAHDHAEAGADMVRVRIPQTARGGNRGNSVAYYEEVTRHSPVPVIVIHQTWQTGGQAATPEEIAAICALDNVFAYICWQDVRFESYVRQLVPPGTRFWAPNGSLLLPFALAGADGACCFFADWAPDTVRRIIELASSGDVAAAQQLQRSIVPADFVGMKYGVRALKAGLQLLGYDETAPRRPNSPLTADEVAELEVAFKAASIL